jgi:AraC-like DNA-binding protein
MSSTRPSWIEEMRLEAQNIAEGNIKALKRQEARTDPNKDLFRIKTADQWLTDEHDKPPARQLMGSLWHEHELCILFADTNLGKSILAVQIGYNLGKQSFIEPFCSQFAEPLKVLYIDFELSSNQFKARYTDPQDGTLHFGENFVRAEFNPDGDDPLLYERYDDYIRSRIEAGIKKTKAKILIIDNITCLGNATNNANSALPLMKNLKALKSKYQLSVLVLAHTPKRNQQRPITVNDLQGSKMLSNFCDSAFAIGQSATKPNLRYIKQIKQRNTGNDYGADHIALFNIKKQHSLLGFEFEGYDMEQLHLQKIAVVIDDKFIEQVNELNRQGLSLRQIATHLKVSAPTVMRALKKVKVEAAT